MVVLKQGVDGRGELGECPAELGERPSLIGRDSALLRVLEHRAQNARLRADAPDPLEEDGVLGKTEFHAGTLEGLAARQPVEMRGGGVPTEALRASVRGWSVVSHALRTGCGQVRDGASGEQGGDMHAAGYSRGASGTRNKRPVELSVVRLAEGGVLSGNRSVRASA